MELSELVSDVEDITDPASMEKLMMYYEQIQLEDEEYMELLLNKVQNEVVTWPQPWYQRTGGLTRPLDPNGRDDSETFRTDSFDKEETERLAKNWRKFRKTFHVPDKPDSFARWRNKTKSRSPRTDVEKCRQFITACLAKGLKRNLYQVYMYFVAQYAAPVKGQYSEIEEKIMQICFYHKATKAVPYLTVILGREARGISKRLQISLGKENGKGRLKWSLPVATKFLQSLIEHSGLPLTKLKYAKIETSVWLKVQDDMKHPYPYLHRFWYRYLHAQLFVKYNVKLQYLRRRILKRLKSNYQVWTDIRWKELLNEFPDGFTHLFLYQAIQPFIKEYPGNYRTDSLRNVAKYGLKKLKNKTKKSKEKRLRALVLNKDGNLEKIKYSEEMPW